MSRALLVHLTPLLLCGALLLIGGCDSGQASINTRAARDDAADYLLPPSDPQPLADEAGPAAPSVSSKGDSASPDTVRIDVTAKPIKPADRVKYDAASDSANPSKTPSGRTAAREVREITFDTIKFKMETGEAFRREMLTDQIERLSGQDVRIRGYVLPSFKQRGITQFVLVRDNMECCFGPGAALFDSIMVEMAENKSIDYTLSPVAVEGTFSVREMVGPDGKHLGIYYIHARAVN